MIILLILIYPAQAGTAHSLYSDSEQLLQPGSEEPAHPAAGKLLRLLKLLMLPDRLNLDITCHWVKKLFGEPKQQSGSFSCT